MEERGMSEDEFLGFVDKAKEKMGNSLSLDDMYHLVSFFKNNSNSFSATPGVSIFLCAAFKVASVI